MNRSWRVRARIVTIIAALGVVAFLAFAWAGHRPIAYHNACLRSAIGTATSIELSLVPQYDRAGWIIPPAPPVVVTQGAEIDRVLRHFQLPWHQRASGLFHECAGLLRVKITLPGSARHTVRYDHGNGIYSISRRDDSPGFCDLPEAACRDLNRYFHSLGYSNNDLGIGE